MRRTGSVTVEELLSHSEWLGRLARHLVGEAGEDAVQEVWLAAHRAGPDPGRPARPWLAGVLRNVGQTWRRNEGRRARREREYQDTLAATSPAVDASYERLELQRLLADRMIALDRPLREVVVMRYLEGLDSRHIARITGEPEGTVRWRLKTALDRLRAELDEHHGGRGQRHRWVAVLGAGSTRGPAITAGAMFMASTKTKTVWAIVAVLLALGGASWILFDRSRSTGEIASANEPAFIATVGRRRAPGAREPAEGRLHPGGGHRASGFVAARDLPECRRLLDESSQELVDRSRAAGAYVPSLAFQQGPLNPALRTEVAPQIARFWTPEHGKSGLRHELECRAWACRLTVTVPGPDSDEVGAWLQAVEPVMQVKGLRALKLQSPSPRGIALEVEGWTPMAEEQPERQGRWLERFVFFFGAPLSGAAASAAGVAVATTSQAAAQPETLADCQARLDTARQQVTVRDAQLDGFAPLEESFATARGPNASLTEKVREAANRRLGPDQRARVECRGSICKLQLSQPADPSAMARLGNDDALGGGAQVEPARDDTTLFVRPIESGWSVLSRMLEPSRKPGFFSGCPEPERAGTLLVRLHVPWTGRRNDDGEFGRVSIRVLGGALATAPAGVCLAERIGALVAAEELPAPVGDFMRMESWAWAPGSPPVMHDR